MDDEQFGSYRTVRSLYCVATSVADPHPHPHESAWFWSPGSASGIRIPNADSRCGCGSGINYVKIAPMIKKLKFLNISLVYFKGKVQREFRPVF
jgi:hypothetical protein